MPKRKVIVSALVLTVIGGSWAIAQQSRPPAVGSPAGSVGAPKANPAAQGTKAAPAKPSATAPGKPAAGKAAPAKPAAGTSGDTPLSAEDQAKKNEILKSKQWRRAMFELEEWLSAQQIYDAKQVEQVKAAFRERVAKATPTELEFMIQDMAAKFQILESPQAQDARAWLGNYLSKLADKKREEIVSEMPNFATMTAAQLSQEIAKIQLKRANMEKSQAAFDRSRAAQVNDALRNDRAAQQAYIQQAQAAENYYSPYRSGASSGGGDKRPFKDVPLGPSLQFYSGSYGGFGVSFNPNSW